MKWKIIYYNKSIKEDVRTLHKSILAKYEAILDKILAHGPDIGLPFTRDGQRTF